MFRKGTSFRLHKKVLDTSIYTYFVYCPHEKSKCPLMLNKPNPNSITIEKGISAYTLLDYTQETTQVMSVNDNVVFIEIVKTSDLEMNNDLHLCSTQSYIYPLTENDSRNKLSGSTVSQDELASNFSVDVKSLQIRITKMTRNLKPKQHDENFFLSSVLLNKHS